MTGADRNRPLVSHSNLGSIIAAELNERSILTPRGGAHPSVSFRVGRRVVKCVLIRTMRIESGDGAHTSCIGHFAN